VANHNDLGELWHMPKKDLECWRALLEQQIGMHENKMAMYNTPGFLDQWIR